MGFCLAVIEKRSSEQKFAKNKLRIQSANAQFPIRLQLKATIQSEFTMLFRCRNHHANAHYISIFHIVFCLFIISIDLKSVFGLRKYSRQNIIKLRYFVAHNSAQNFSCFSLTLRLFFFLFLLPEKRLVTCSSMHTIVT